MGRVVAVRRRWVLTHMIRRTVGVACAEPRATGRVRVPPVARADVVRHHAPRTAASSCSVCRVRRRRGQLWRSENGKYAPCSRQWNSALGVVGARLQAIGRVDVAPVVGAVATQPILTSRRPLVVHPPSRRRVDGPVVPEPCNACGSGRRPHGRDHWSCTQRSRCSCRTSRCTGCRRDVRSGCRCRWRHPGNPSCADSAERGV